LSRDIHVLAKQQPTDRLTQRQCEGDIEQACRVSPSIQFLIFTSIEKALTLFFLTSQQTALLPEDINMTLPTSNSGRLRAHASGSSRVNPTRLTTKVEGVERNVHHTGASCGELMAALASSAGQPAERLAGCAKKVIIIKKSVLGRNCRL